MFGGVGIQKYCLIYIKYIEKYIADNVKIISTSAELLWGNAIVSTICVCWNAFYFELASRYAEVYFAVGNKLSVRVLNCERIYFKDQRFNSHF
jgi:hypothetical protein